MKNIRTKQLALTLIVCSSFSLAACSNKSRLEPQAEISKPNINTLSVAPVITPPIKTVASVAAKPHPQVSTIRARDKLDILVFKVPELSAKDITVEATGNVSLPFIGTVNLLGLSIQQAEDRIEALLRKDALQDPKVSIKRTQQTIKRITVEGAVKTPGVFPITDSLSFLQAVAMSQGLTELADTKNVVVFRDGKQYAVDLDKVRRGITPDPILKEDDRIVVLKSDKKVKEKKILQYLPALASPLSLIL